jgi:hypothetical protein
MAPLAITGNIDTPSRDRNSRFDVAFEAGQESRLGSGDRLSREVGRRYVEQRLEMVQNKVGEGKEGGAPKGRV